MKPQATDIRIPQTTLAKEALERYSSATTLTVIELEIFLRYPRRADDPSTVMQ